MSRVIGVITARMGSTRSPGKVLRLLQGRSVFAHHVERMKLVQGLAAIYLATSMGSLNNPLVEEAKRLGVKYFQGSEEDIAARHIAICEAEEADAVIRVTCDMPLFDMDTASRYIEEHNRVPHDYMYVSNMTMIQGTVPEFVGYQALLRAHAVYKGPAITQPIKQNLADYKTLGIEMPDLLVRPEYRLTLDVEEDFTVIEKIYEELYQGSPISLYEVYKFLDDYPEIPALNSKVKIKGCEVLSANLLERPLYSVVKSGSGFIVLDENKSHVPYDEFRRAMDRLLVK